MIPSRGGGNRHCALCPQEGPFPLSGPPSPRPGNYDLGRAGQSLGGWALGQNPRWAGGFCSFQPTNRSENIRGFAGTAR